MNALGGIVTLFRHRTRDIRRLLEFGEVLDSGDVNVLHRWNFKTDNFDKRQQHDEGSRRRLSFTAGFRGRR